MNYNVDHLELARLAHEVNRQYVLGLRDRTPPPMRALGGIPLDPPPPQPEPLTFDQETEAFREAMVQSVMALLRDTSAGPGEMHQRWMTSKFAQGWKYGPVKDHVRCEHPDLIPFDQLPAAERTKDFIFRAIVLNAAKLFLLELPGETPIPYEKVRDLTKPKDPKE